MNFLTFLLLQLDRIKPPPTSHAPGPRKPGLSQMDAEQK